jgi:hypothetical protein
LERSCFSLTQFVISLCVFSLATFILDLAPAYALSPKMQREVIKELSPIDREAIENLFDQLDAPPRTRFRNVSIETPALPRTFRLNNIEKAAAVIDTSVDGVEAGVSLAPFALAGFDALGLAGLTVTLASLEDDQTRAAVAYSWGTTPDDPTLEDLDLTCAKRSALEDFVSQLVDMEEAFPNVCSKFVPEVDESRLDEHGKRNLEQIALVCRIGTAEGTHINSLQTLSTALRIIERQEKSDSDVDVPYAITERYTRLKDELDPFLTYEMPTRFSCFKSSDEKFATAVDEFRWKQQVFRFGTGAQADFFAFESGFRAECEGDAPPVSCSRESVEFASVQPKVEAEWSSGSWSTDLGVGYIWERESIEEDLEGFFFPSFSYKQLVTTLGSKEAWEKGAARLVGGIIFETKLRVFASDDKELLQSFTGTAFVDVVLTNELGFRLGIPVEVEREETTPEGDEAPESGLNVTLPVFVTTVLTL